MMRIKIVQEVVNLITVTLMMKRVIKEKALILIMEMMMKKMEKIEKVEMEKEEMEKKEMEKEEMEKEEMETTVLKKILMVLNVIRKLYLRIFGMYLKTINQIIKLLSILNIMIIK